MSEIMNPQLAPVALPAFNAVGDTGALLQLSQLPDQMDGKATYLRQLNLRIVGTITQASGGPIAVNLTQLISAVFLNIPGVRVIVNSVSGNRLARIFRTRSFGETPTFGAGNYGVTNPWTAIAQLPNGVSSIDMTFPLQFSDIGQRRFDDNAIPCALLKQIGQMKVSFPALTALNAAITASSLQLIVTPVMYAKAEKKLGPLPVLDSVDIVGVQPVLNPFEGKVSNLLIQPQNDGVFPNTTDYAQAGVGWGGFVQTQDATPIDVFYDQFNSYAQVAMPKHTQTDTDPTASIPLWYPPGGHQGEHATYEMINPGAQPRIRTNAAAQAYSVVFRMLLDQRSSAMSNARKILGLTDTEPKTASKKPTASVDVAAFIPAKQA